ncbi:hypothetical protein MRX96_047822 [Rhipicephalus microplus]
MESQPQTAGVSPQYSPPCTRSQTERFALQLKVQAEEENRRASIMSQRPHDRSILKSMKHLVLGKVDKENRWARHKKRRYWRQRDSCYSQRPEGHAEERSMCSTDW